MQSAAILRAMHFFRLVALIAAPASLGAPSFRRSLPKGWETGVPFDTSQNSRALADAEVGHRPPACAASIRVDGTVAWASGTGGTVLRTTDGGAHWQKMRHPDADKDGATLDFRGVQAWDATTAIVMASGPGDKSRLYKTTDGCTTWALLFENPDSLGAVGFDQRLDFYGPSTEKASSRRPGQGVFLRIHDRGRRQNLETGPAQGLSVHGKELAAFAASTPVCGSGQKSARF